MKERQLGSSSHPVPFLLVSDSDHSTGVTGLSPTVTISKDGGAFAAPAGAVSEIGDGWYKLAANATDRDTLGDCLLHATGTGADPTDAVFTIVAYDPFDAVRLGLTALPNANATAAGGLPVSAAGGLDLDEMNADIEAIETTVAANLDAAVSGVATQSSVDEANADLDEVIATIGVAGAGLTAIPGGGSDPLLNAVPGSYASGTAGYALGHAPTAAEIAADLSGSPIVYTGPMTATGDVAIVSGDDYDASVRTVPQWAVLPTVADLTGATVVVEVFSGATTVLSADGSVLNAGASNQAVQLELTSAQTLLTPPMADGGDRRYSFKVRATLTGGGGRVTLVEGVWMGQR